MDSTQAMMLHDLIEIGGGELDTEYTDEYIRVMTPAYQVWFDWKTKGMEIEVACCDFYVTIRVNKDNYVQAANYLKTQA